MFDWDFLPTGHCLRLILLRHGEPEQEIQGKCYGSLDVGLSDTGRMQIQSKIDFIRNSHAVALYASPLKRAVESATIASACLRIETRIRSELQEINFGRFEGLSYDEIETLYPQRYKLWMESPTKIQFPQGESFSDMKARVLNFKESLVGTCNGQTVVVVSHGGPNRIILAEALGIPDELVFRIDQAYAAVNVIDYFQQHPVVRLLNG